MSDTMDWVVDTLTVLGGGVVGVLFDKLVGDVLLKFGIQQPEFMPIHLQVHDVMLVAGELAGAYFARNKIPLASKFLVGMAAGVIVTDAFQTVSDMGQWFLSSPTAKAYGAELYQ